MISFVPVLRASPRCRAGTANALQQKIIVFVKFLCEVFPCIPPAGAYNGAMKGKRILLIQSGQTEGNSTKWHLEESGYQVVSAGSGLTGLTLARQGSIDLILLDVVLPDREGFDLCHRLRTGIETRSIPIILLIGRGYSVDRSIPRTLGPDDYLTKPFTRQEMDTKISALIRLGPVRTPSVQVPSPADTPMQRTVPLSEQRPHDDPPQAAAERPVRKTKGASVSYLKPLPKPDPAAAPERQDPKPTPLLPFLGKEDTVIDPATGLFGRPQFEAMFSKEFKRAVRFKQQLSCMLIELEDLNGKPVEGPTVRSVIALIQKTIREVDTAAWWSGESFIVLLPNTIRNDAVQAAARVLEAVAINAGMQPGSPNVAINIGVAGLPDKNIDTEKKLIESAVAACRRARELMVPHAGHASLLNHRRTSSLLQPPFPSQRGKGKN